MDYIKEGGQFKEVDIPYIKVNGVWKESDAEFIKVGGHWSDVSHLSATKLDYDMTIASDADGSRYLVNKAEPTTHKAPLHSGHSVTLKGTGKIEVPINATLVEIEATKNKNFDTDIADWTLGHSWNTRTWNSVNKSLIVKIHKANVNSTTLCGTEFIQPLDEVKKGFDVKVYYKIISKPAGKILRLCYFNPIGNRTIGTGFKHINIKDSDLGKDLVWEFNTKINTLFANLGLAFSLEGGQELTDVVEIAYTRAVKLEATAVHGSVTVWNETLKKLEQGLPADIKDYMKPTVSASDFKVISGVITDGGDHWLITSNAGLSARVILHLAGAQTPFKDIPDPLDYPTTFTVKIEYDTDLAHRAFGANLGTHSKTTPNDVTRKGTYVATIEMDDKVITTNKYIQTYAGIDGTIKIYKNMTMGGIKNVKVSNGALPLATTYPIQNGTYGIICKLHTNKFTQADLDAMTASPEKLIGWYFGTATLPSGIVKGADDKVYFDNKELGGVGVLALSGANTVSTTSKYGVQSLLIKEDANGIPTGLAKANTIEGSSDGRFVHLPLVDNTKQKHLITKCLKEIKGDITQVVDIECIP